MKKKIFGAEFLMVGILSFISVQTSHANTSEDVIRTGEKGARKAYCQIWGDRIGCKSDPLRNCSLDIFCN